MNDRAKLFFALLLWSTIAADISLAKSLVNKLHHCKVIIDDPDPNLTNNGVIDVA